MFAFRMGFFLNRSVFVAGHKMLEPHVRCAGRYKRSQTGFGLHPIFEVATWDSVALFIEMIGIVADRRLAWMVKGRRMEDVVFHRANGWLGWGSTGENLTPQNYTSDRSSAMGC